METIVKMIFGSHLYGTQTPESDTDFKGVFMPSINDILLGKISKSLHNDTGNSVSKNSKDDVDDEIFSLHHFIKLACEGQTVALDMLHTPENMIIESSDTWKRIVENKEKFYTKNLSAFIGYAQRQAAKYGIKGSRLDECKKLICFLNQFNPNIRLKEVWNDLPVGEHIHHMVEEHKGIKQFKALGKIFQETVKISNCLNSLNKFHNEFGERSKLAAANQGIDFKAISHAVRAALQVEELLTKKTITFPLKEAKLLTDIKMGKLNYLSEVAPLLEELMIRVEGLSKESDLPEKVDRKFWDSFIIDECVKRIKKWEKKT